MAEPSVVAEVTESGLSACFLYIISIYYLSESTLKGKVKEPAIIIKYDSFEESEIDNVFINTKYFYTFAPKQKDP